MKSRFLTTAAAVALTTLALSSPANAMFIPTSSTFFTPASDGTLTFTYEGFSAADTDTMVFAFNGDTIFTNKTTPAGTSVTQNVMQGQPTG